jgi:trehalose 6-phosphate phosphatase
MLRSGCRSAVYFGDDDNDEDVFTLGEESLMTVRVGRGETSSALFYLDSQVDIDQALEKCLISLERSGKTPRDANEQGAFNETTTH